MPSFKKMNKDSKIKVLYNFLRQVGRVNSAQNFIQIFLKTLCIFQQLTHNLSNNIGLISFKLYNFI